MSDKMTPIPIAQLLNWILAEHEKTGAIFGVSKLFHADKDKTCPMFNERIEIPFGPAAGPHTQLAQNIIAAYAAGARFFELKTVQSLDGDDLNVQKPCISAGDECYNTEWSTELYVSQALEEYIKAWFVCKLLAREYSLGDPDGFVFNMSVGYDLQGIKSQKIDGFIESMRNAGATPIWRECLAAAQTMASRFKHVNNEYIYSISSRVCDSITLSTLHGCPPREIENIATYLLRDKGIHTFVKCNPTLLGYDYARQTLDSLGYDYVTFDEHHFNNDLQYEDAVTMFRRLQRLADDSGLCFGVKLTNTLPVQINHGELPGNEMYMSGRSLYPLTISLAEKLARDFSGCLRISFCGGVDARNVADLIKAGIWPVTVATTLLKPGGYNRIHQIAETLYTLDYGMGGGIGLFSGSPSNGRWHPHFPNYGQAYGYRYGQGQQQMRWRGQQLKQQAFTDPMWRKPVKPLPCRKLEQKIPLIDCFTAPCCQGCPIHQDIPAYVGLVGEGKYLEALQVIVDKNPLPFITGTICNHRCMDKCTRNFYEQAINIRDTKLQAAQQAMDQLLDGITPAPQTGQKAAVIGGGAAGLASAYFLALQGIQVTLFEKDEQLGGIVRNVIPAFRIADNVIEQDIRLIRKMGVNLITGSAAPSIGQLKAQGYRNIILAIGATRQGEIEMAKQQKNRNLRQLNAMDFLRDYRLGAEQQLGKNVAIIGGGNTAMDAARAAKRVEGVQHVHLVYRRTKRYMPADEEELRQAMDEGVEFMELLAPISHGDGTLVCSKMQLGQPDESGRRRPMDTGERAEIPADTVIAAVGEKVDDSMLNAMGIATDESGKPVVDENLMTNLPGVFIAGDAHRGPATVVEAIADAATIADAICKPRPAGTFSYHSSKARDKKGVLMNSSEAKCEGQRCLECDSLCECCVDVCPNRANVSVNVNGRPQILHMDKLCNECGNCETFCPYSSAPYKDKLTLFATKAEFESSANQGFIVGDNGCTVRLDGRIFNYTKDKVNCLTTATAGGLAEIPEDIMALIQVVISDYSYML